MNATVTGNMIVLPPNAVLDKNGRAVTTTLTVAETFARRHYDVLRSVKELDCSEEFAQRNFALGSYLDANNQPRPVYEMTKDGFIFLVMGFSGPEAARRKEAYIQCFNEMEAALLQPQPAPQLPPPASTIEISEVEYLRLKNELLELKLEKSERTKRARNNPTREQEEEILRLSRQGHGPTEIGKRVGRPVGGVSAILKRLRHQGRVG